MQFERKRFAVALVLVVGALAPALARADESIGRNRFDTIVIDAGHGGDDSGARGAAGLLVGAGWVQIVPVKPVERIAWQGGSGEVILYLPGRDRPVPPRNIAIPVPIDLHAGATQLAHTSQPLGIGKIVEADRRH